MKEYLFIPKILVFVSILFTLTEAYGQVGIGTTDPDDNALLDVSSANKGLLIPRVELTSTNLPAPLSAHVAGMMVYNTAFTFTGTTAVSPGFYYNDGNNWIKAGDATAGDQTDDAWVNNNADGRIELGTLSDGITARPKGTQLVVTDTGYLGIGTDSPTESLHIYGDDSDILVFSHGRDEITSMHVHVAGGSALEPTPVNTRPTNNIFQLTSKGYDGSKYITSAGIILGVDDAANSGPEDMPGKIIFRTTPDGSTGLLDRMTIKNNGAVGIGTNIPKVSLDVNGLIKAKGFTVNQLLQLNPVQGAMAYVIDANTAPTYLQTVTGSGGGTLVLPVFCDGTKWVYH